MAEVEAPWHAWRRDPRVVALVTAAVLVAAGVAWWRAGTASAPAGPRTPAADALPTTTTTTAAVDPTVLVHVVGAVRTPGVVELPAGARVVDALRAAGGALDGADLERVNLAAPLADGQRVAVPRVGEPGLPPVPGDAAAGPAGDAAAGPLDLNTATAAQLEELPGIGPALAEAIVSEREKLGGFRRVEDLQRVRGIGPARYAQLRDLVTV